MTSDDLIRRGLPGYDIGGELGRGGCGVVLSGVHRALGRRVAIKQIPPQFATDRELRNRFDAEARLMASINHPHVVAIFDYVVQDDLCVIVMEHLPGGTVAQRFATQGLDPGSSVAVALSAAAGLHAAHKRGVLHRDVKPGNLMFAPDGSVKLTDFGIAKIIGGDDTLMTKAGEIIGTPSYIAPEQARGQELTPATDVYALATMLYQLLSGVLPFPPTEDSISTLFLHAFEAPTPLRDKAPNIPEPIADAVMRGLATDPSDRFQTAEEFGIALAAPSAQCWGSDWLAPVGIPVIGADTILMAATGGSRAPIPPDETELHTPMLGKRPVVPPPPPPRPPTPMPPPVRQAQRLPPAGVALVDVSRSDVAPVQKVVDFRSPRVPFLVAAVLGLVAVALALVGLGSPERGGDLRPGVVTVAGVDPTTADVIELDLSKPIAVTSTEGTTVRLSTVVLGQPLGGKEVALVPGTPTELDAPVNRYLLAGNLTGQITVSDAENILGTYRFAVRSTQPAYTTALAVAVVALALFAVAYIESYIRSLRRGRSRLSGSVGLPLSAACLAVAVVGAGWVLLGHEPTVIALVASAVVAAAAGVAATLGAMRIGARARYRRARRRAR